VKSNVDLTFSSLLGSGRFRGTTTVPFFSRIHTYLISIWTSISIWTPQSSLIICHHMKIY